MCFENESLTKTISIFLLLALNQVSSDSSLEYLDVLEGFMELDDDLVIKRIEWIFGYPQPTVSKTVNGVDHYGSYHQQSLDTTHISLQTSTYYQGCNGFLNLLLQNRRQYETQCMVQLRSVLEIMTKQPAFFDYIVNLPAPTYTQTNFYDWFGPFIENFIIDSKNYRYL
jgi:hypothetical protein